MTTPKQQKIIDKELQRGRKLLSAKRIGQPLIETEADPSPETLGAIAGIGLRTENPVVLGNLYVFDSWDDSEATITRLDDQTLPGGNYQVTAMNGVMIFVARADISTADGKTIRHLLNKMLAAFSGDE